MFYYVDQDGRQGYTKLTELKSSCSPHAHKLENCNKKCTRVERKSVLKINGCYGHVITPTCQCHICVCHYWVLVYSSATWEKRWWGHSYSSVGKTCSAMWMHQANGISDGEKKNVPRKQVVAEIVDDIYTSLVSWCCFLIMSGCSLLFLCYQ
jgi:hypothetical protein